jgi:hypothetical protein
MHHPLRGKRWDFKERPSNSLHIFSLGELAPTPLQKSVLGSPLILLEPWVSSLKDHFTRSTLLQPSIMGRLVGEQEPNEKKCYVHTPSIHPSIVVHLWVFNHSSSFTQHLLTYLSFPSKKREMLNMKKKKKKLVQFFIVYMECAFLSLRFLPQRKDGTLHIRFLKTSRVLKIRCFLSFSNKFLIL